MSAQVMEAEEEIISGASFLVVVLHQRKQSRGSRGSIEDEAESLVLVASV